MLLSLIKKQYWECFRSYFINPKTGKPRSKVGMAGMFVLFSAVLLMLSGSFFSISLSLGNILRLQDASWLFYALMGGLSLLLGVFGSVFGTYSMLYLPKDNELLLAMPIPPRTILLSRMSLVYGLAFVYSGIVWVPAVLYAWLFASVSAVQVLFQIVLTLFIALLVSALTCLLGWVVALISKRVRHKNAMIVIIVLLLFFGYYYVSMNLTGLLFSILTNASVIGKGVRIWANLLYQLGRAADGNAGALLIFIGVCLGLSALCLWGMAKSFLGIVTRPQSVRRKTGSIRVHTSSLPRTLLRREAKLLTSSVTYMLNCCLGLVIFLAAAVLMLAKQSLVRNYLPTIRLLFPAIRDFLPTFLLLALCMISSMNFISTPSVSLEGKHLWILRSLPVSGRQVLRAKLQLHVLLNLFPILAALAAAGYVLKVPLTLFAAASVFAVGHIWFLGAFGLVLGVLHPNFQWTSDTVPIKQSLNCFVSMLVGFLLPVAVGVACWLLHRWLSPIWVLTGADVLLLLAAIVTNRWLYTKGAAVFESL